MLNLSVHSYPMLRIAVVIAVGIVLQSYAKLSTVWLSLLLLVTFILALIPWEKRCALHHRNYALTLKHYCLLAFTLLCGMFLSSLHEQRFVFPENELIPVSAHVLSYGEKKNSTMQYIMEISPLASPLKKYETLVYISDKNTCPKLQPGHCIHVELRLRKPKNFPSSTSFDYPRYLNSKGIAAITYISEGQEVKILGQYHNLKTWSSEIQHSTIAKLRQAGVEKTELGTLSALTLGERRLISDTIKEDFSNAGAMHILAVSGLHVGIVYVIIQFLFLWLKRLKGGTFVLAILTLILLWSYALITGFSPSVWRTALMFSLFTLAPLLSKKNYPLNTLGAAALIMLVFNPFLIFNLGFQLSVTAVAAIILFYPPISKLIRPSNAILRFIWQLSCLALAAQLGTLPLSLYYFHQFPVFFLFSNIWAISWAAIILYSTVLFVITIPLESCSKYIAQILQYELKWLHKGITFISELPLAVIETKNFSILHLYSYYLLLFGISYFIYTYKQINKNRL